MSVETANAILMTAGAYLAIGGVVGVPFILFGAPRLDHAARGSGLFFRLAILPGVIGLWPAIIVRALSFRKINAPIDS
ncbi:MAG: hypothetical protein AAF224_12085 [Pseudomonadota bacterium]